MTVAYYVILLVCTMFIMAGWGMWSSNRDASVASWGMATVFFSLGLFMKVMDFV